ncbi:MAG: alkaline phosphatase family protein [Pseudomonadota bacterium]
MNAKTRPNVLLVTADQWRGDCLSAVGHPCLQTPNFDALIADGVLFRNHYSVCAPCAPARASLLTGMYQHNHRVVGNGAPLDNRFDNLALALRRADYEPKLFGYTDTSLDPRAYSEAQVIQHGYENILPGFEEGLLLADGDPQPWMRYLRERGYDIKSAADLYQQQRDSRKKGKTFAPTIVRDEDSQTAFITRHAIDFVEHAAPGWCMHLSYLRPHPPFVASEPWNSMYSSDDVPMPTRGLSAASESEIHPWVESVLTSDTHWFDPWFQKNTQDPNYEREMRQVRATYFGLVSKVDHYFGQLIHYLKSSGQYENTIIVLTSDHGELLGDHWLFGKRGYFDSAYHIPLIIRTPDQENRGAIESRFTESVDVMPTILDALNAPIPRQCDGASLLPFLRNEAIHRVRDELHWEFDFRDLQNDSNINRKLSREDCRLCVIRNENFKYVHFPAQSSLLFDLQNDPTEQRNLIDSPAYASVGMELQQRMLSWRMRSDEKTLTHLEVTRSKIIDHETA